MTKKGGTEVDSVQRTAMCVVNGSSLSDWDCFQDVPREAYEDWEHFSCPQVIAIARSPRVALIYGSDVIRNELKQCDFKEDAMGRPFPDGQNPVDKMTWYNLEGNQVPIDPVLMNHGPESVRKSYTALLKDEAMDVYACLVILEVEVSE